LGIVKKKLPGTFVVLCYHEIVPEHPEKFANQVKEVIRITKPVNADYKEPLQRGKHYVAITFDDGFQCLLENAFPELYRYRIPFTVFIPTAFIGQSPGWITDEKNKNRNEFVMTSEQIKTIQENLVTVGSHCVTHPHLTLMKESEVRKELIESRNNLKDIWSSEIKLLAFPYGEYNEKILEWAKQAGYKRVFSGLPTAPFSKKDGFLSGRIDVSPDDWLIEFRLKLMGAYTWLPLAVTLKSKLRKSLRYFMDSGKSKK